MALAAGLALVAWLATRDQANEAPAEAAKERSVTESELRKAAMTLPYTVYWAGPLPGAKLQLVESQSGALVRYFRGEADNSESLAIGSYPVADPNTELNRFAARPNSKTLHGAGGSKVVFSEEQPTSVYFADPAGGVQVEVYDPSPVRALRLARSARVRPVR